MIKTYYLLTKPGIIMGNLIATVSGFMLASQGVFDGSLFAAVVTGLGLVIASACVFNNYFDRDIDEKMARTKNRPLVKGLISGKSAIVFASFLGMVGFVILILYTNWLTVAAAAIGFIVYVCLYTFWKRSASWATLVGSLAGSIPPVVGYFAVSNKIDLGAVLLFLILVLWQMPHFYSIAIYRLKEYAAASIPLLPVRKGTYVTKVHIVVYVVAYLLATVTLFALGYTGYGYLVTALVFGGAWLFFAVQGFWVDNDVRWARKMFQFSILVITALCIAISVDSF
jgi:protoheme IX farnesyltransferase